MNENSKFPGRKWWMGWPALFRIIYGAFIPALIWLIVALDGRWDEDDAVISSVAIFPGLVILAVLAYWFQSAIAWVFRRIWKLLRWLSRWRLVRRYLYGLSAISCVVALFYAEEDWRGKRDWEQYKRAAEARGERFDLASFAPPKVPDDQNFAFAPIVSNSCLCRIDPNVLQPLPPEVSTTREPLLDVRINAKPEWKPWPTNDFMGDWQRGKLTDLKVFQDYYRAPVNPKWQNDMFASLGHLQKLLLAQPDAAPLQGATNEFREDPQTQSPAEDVLLALSKHDAAIDELREASRRPFFQFPCEPYPDSPNRYFSPEMEPLKECLAFLRLRAVAELENNQSEKALADVKLMLFMANLDLHEPWREIWRQNWRIKGIMAALQPVWHGMAGHKWSDAQLSLLDAELAKFDFLSDYQLCVRSTCAETIWRIHSFERTRFHEFWSELYFGPDLYDRSRWDMVFNRDTLVVFMPRGWFYENDVAVARATEQWLRTDTEIKRRILSAEVADRLERTTLVPSERRTLRDFALSMVTEPVAHNFAFAQSSLDRALVACALERYRLAAGEYPATLDVLAPHFINPIPNDIINGQPLHYRRTGDGQYLLYSVGWNGTDDGGAVVQSKNQKLGIFGSNLGDWVWPSIGAL
jgi:hypothetical protein